MPTSINYQTVARVLNQTLSRYLGRVGKAGALVNEVVPRTLMGAKLFKNLMVWTKGGFSIKTPLQFNRAEAGQWVGPGQKLTLKGNKATTWTDWPFRIYRWAHFVDEIEMLIQGDEETMLISILDQAKEDFAIAICLAIEDALLAPDGNYAHDGAGTDYLTMFGWRHLITIDGKHITGDTSRSIGGINPVTQPLWKHPYINPVEASDGRAAIRSVQDLRKAWGRLFRQLQFASIKDWGKLASNAKDNQNPSAETTKRARLEDYHIFVDSGTYDEFPEICFDRQDNVGRDQGLIGPVYKGVDIEEAETLGVDKTYGYGFNSAGEALWTDRGSSYASGQWKGWGESCVFNTKYMRLACLPDNFPKVYDAYKPELMAGMAMEGMLVAQLMTASRRRQGGFVGPFELTEAA